MRNVLLLLLPVFENTYFTFFIKKNQKFVTLKYGLSKLILTLTGQKLIEWSLKLFMFFTLILTFFLHF